MLTYETQRLLKNLVLEVGRGEQKIELIRQKLASFDDFEPYVAFQRVDRNRNDTISQTEILDFLKDNKIFSATQEEADYLVKFFDSDEDYRLSYSDFLQLLVPCDNNFLRCQVTQREPYKVDKFQYLPIHIENELSNLIFSEIELFRRTEELRKDLERRHDFSTYGCFRAVDDRNEGDVNPDNLRAFLKNNGYYPTEDEVIAIIRRLDLDADCKINYAEFCEAIKTQEFSSKVPVSKPNELYQSRQEDLQRELSRSQGLSEEKFLKSQSQFGKGSYASPSKSGFQQSYTSSGQYQRSSPLRPQDEDELIKAFKQQLILDRDLEKSKIDLIESCQDFNLFDAFRILDQQGKGYVTSYDLKDAFDDPRGIDLPQITTEDIELFIARYDKDRDRRIRFSEFASAFTPSDPYYADRLNAKKSSNYALSDKTLFIYRNLWLTQVKVEQQAEYIRDRLSQKTSFSLVDAFRAVDINDDGRITKDELQRIIERSGFKASQQEIQTLMERYDKDGDGAISFVEFSDEIKPHSPSKQKNQYYE